MFYEVLHILTKISQNVRKNVHLSNPASSLAIFQPIKARVNSHDALQSHTCAWSIATHNLSHTSTWTIATPCYCHTIHGQ